MNSLSQIEKEGRKSVIKKCRLLPTYSFRSMFILGAWIAPFVFSGSMFIPLIGMLLSILCIALTFYFLYLNSSFPLLLSWLSGGCVSILTLMLIFSSFFSRSHVVGYFLIALSVFSLLCYLLKISALIVNRIEEATT